MTIPKKRVERMADDQAMIDGTQKFFASSATLTFGSQTLAPAAIVKVFQDRIDKAKAAIAAGAAKTAAVKEDRDEQAQSGTLVRAFTRFVQATFTEEPDTLAAFHLTAPKVGKKSAAVKAKAAAKGVAKREAAKAAKATIDGAAAAPPPPVPPPKPTA